MRRRGSVIDAACFVNQSGDQTLSQMVDAGPALLYKLPMICAFLMNTTDSRGVAVGPEGMRVR
jgi:hypothetical protein